MCDLFFSDIVPGSAILNASKSLYLCELSDRILVMLLPLTTAACSSLLPLCFVFGGE